MKIEMINCIMQIAGIVVSVLAFAMSLYALITYKTIKKEATNEKEKRNSSL